MESLPEGWELNHVCSGSECIGCMVLVLVSLVKQRHLKRVDDGVSFRLVGGR